MPTTTHAIIYRLNDDVMTKQGPASFIGYMRDRNEAQVSRYVRRDGKRVLINPVIPLGDITGLITVKKQTRAAKAETQVENIETEGV